MLPALKSLPYKDRLKACNISTLHYRRIRGDKIETYKILTGKYDTLVSPTLIRAGLSVCVLMSSIRISLVVVFAYHRRSMSYDIVYTDKDTLSLGSCITRGNDLRLQKNRFKYDLRKYCFCNRVVNIWNSLPNHVVSANTTNIFKNRLDKFWHDQEIIYD